MGLATEYGDISPRTAAHASKQLLERAEPYLVLEKFGQSKPLPGKSSKVIKFRRFNPLPYALKPVTEGVTPVANKITVTDVTATLVQYADRVVITDVVQDTHEDPVLQENMAILGEQAAQMMENMRFGVVKAGSNVFYMNGSARTDVNTAFTGASGLTMQRKITRALKRQNAKKITKIVSAGPNFNTTPVNAAYIAICHPDVENDIRGISGFTPVEQYPQMTPYPSEIGKVEDVRYLSTTIFEPWYDGGGAKGSMISTAGTSADVYPIIFLAADAYGLVALKGMYAVSPIVVNPKPSDSDPLAQRTHIGWKTMQTAVILQDLWMCRLEAAVTA